MSFRCQICGKGRQYGHRVSHSKRRTKHIWKPNLQKTTIDGKKMLLCTKCLKKIRKTQKKDDQPRTAAR